MKPITAALTLTKETKGTFVYSDDATDAVVPTLYVKRHAFKDAPPQRITLTLSAAK